MYIVIIFYFETANKCSGDPCQNGGACTGDPFSFNCTCNVQYEGPVCQFGKFQHLLFRVLHIENKETVGLMAQLSM